MSFSIVSVLYCSGAGRFALVGDGQHTGDAGEQYDRVG